MQFTRHHMATYIWVNIGTGNAFLPDGTKPLPAPVLTYHRLGPVTSSLGQFHKKYLSHQSLQLTKSYLSRAFLIRIQKFPQENAFQNIVHKIRVL